MSAVTLIVLAKRPRPGYVKTRLTPALTAEQAADLAAAALTDTLATVADAPAAERVLAFDGDPTDWLPRGWRHVPQVDGPLDVRIAHAIAAVGNGPALLVGMDTPQLTVDHLTAFDPDRYEAALGPAHDGGFWALGLRHADTALRAVPGVAMSTAATGADQLARLRGLGYDVQVLDRLTDVDTVDAADEVARLAPSSTFATSWSALQPAWSA